MVYEEIEGEETPKETLRYRKKYMNNLQKSQLEFEEVRGRICLFVVVVVVVVDDDDVLDVFCLFVYCLQSSTRLIAPC